MEATRHLLSVAVIMGSGVTAGVMFCVALSIAPAFAVLSPARYVETHKLIGRGYDRVMPPIVLASILACVILVILPAPTSGRALFAVGALLLLGVSLVSHLGNVPINRRVKSLGPTGPPSCWEDPRPRWRALNLTRTWLALSALGINGLAVVMTR